MEISNKTFLVVGTGISGIAATELLLKKKATVFLYDANTELDINALKQKHPSIVDVPVITGTLPDEIVKEIQIAVVSPGVPTDTEFVQNLKNCGILIWGEIELAYVCGKGRVIAITGTNGKTTTTSLVGHILSMYFPQVSVVGNIGIPYTAVADELTEDAVVVAEISSFQLETIQTFAPKVSAILNITPDHLNRHHTMENYIAAKESITAYQTQEDVCVLNYNDPVLRKFGERKNHRIVFFSATEELPEGLFVKDGAIFQSKNGVAKRVIAVDEMQILGVHNQENAMAAIAICDSMGVPTEVICEGLRTFRAVEHRIEYVCEKNHIAFYNDSKGTNPDAAIKGILAMNRKTVLIGGGYDKNVSFDDWIASFGDKVKKLILIGQTKEKIAACCEAHGFSEYLFADTLEEAVAAAYRIAEDGEAVLLSPACASWGMFDNYEQRGNLFKEYVKNLEE